MRVVYAGITRPLSGDLIVPTDHTSRKWEIRFSPTSDSNPFKKRTLSKDIVPETTSLADTEPLRPPIRGSFRLIANFLPDIASPLR